MAPTIVSAEALKLLYHLLDPDYINLPLGNARWKVAKALAENSNKYASLNTLSDRIGCQFPDLFSVSRDGLHSKLFDGTWEPKGGARKEHLIRLTENNYQLMQEILSVINS